MGLFDGLLGSKYPPLGETHPAAVSLAEVTALEEFAKTANDRIEIVPGPDEVYAFVGKPPKAFGFVWFTGNERHDVRSAVEHGEMTRVSAGRLVNDLGTVYQSYASAERFDHKMAGHRVIVVPSDAMYDALRKAISHARA